VLESTSVLPLLERRGWQALPQGGGWRLSRRGTTDVLYLSATSRWLCLQYPIATGANGRDPRRSTPADQIRLYRHLLGRNEQMFMTKFGLDDAGQPVLTVEVPGRGGNSSCLVWAVEALNRYALKPSLQLGALEKGPPQVASEWSVARVLADETPGVPKETIARYLKGAEAWGWGAKAEPEGPTWHLVYKGRLRVFDVYLTTTRTWSYFQAPTLVEGTASVLRADAPAQAAFLGYLLRLNDACFMAKIGLGEEGQPLLLLEAPTELLDFAFFSLAVRTLATYLDRYGPELYLMASLDRDRNLAELLTRKA